MNRAIPWSIKGVDPDAREAATYAALREGLTLGQWLKQTIEAHAAERGLDAFSLTDDERAAAVKERLARIADHAQARPTNQEAPQTQVGPAFRPQSPNRVDEMLRNLALRLEENAKPAAQTHHDMTARHESERRPLSPLRADSAATRLQDPRESAQNVRKMELIETLRAARALHAARPALKPLNQEAYDEASREMAQDAYPFTPPASVSPPRRREPMPQDAPPLVNASLRRELDQLASKIAASQPWKEASRPAEAQRQDHAWAPPRRSVARPDFNRATDEASSDMRSGLADGISQVSLLSLERHLKSLTSKVDSLCETASSRSAVEALQARTKGLQEQIEEIAARPDNAAKIERQLDLLGSRIDALAASKPTLSDANELAQGLTEIRAILSKAPNQSQLEGLDRKVEQLARKLESALTNADPAPKFDDLARRIDNVHRKLETNASLLAKVDTSALEKMMQELASKLVQPAPKIEIPAPNFAPVESEIRRLANKMDAVASRPENPVLEGLRRDIASLSARVDTVSATAQSAASMANQASAETLEALRKEMAGFSARLDALTASAPEVSVLDGLQSQIALLVDRVEVLTRRDPPGVHALENQIAQLAGKMDIMSAPSRDGAMMIQLQAEIGRLARQIDSSPGEVGAPVLALLEQVRTYLARMPQQGAATGSCAQETAVATSMSDLFRQIQDLRSATADAADLAARTSAHEALETKAQDLAHNPDADAAMKRELQDLRAQQERADRRTTEVLSAVHNTMERLVGRLSSLESEICEIHPEPVAPAKVDGRAERQESKQEPLEASLPEVRAEPRQEPVREAKAPTPQIETPQMETPVEAQATQARTQGSSAALLNRASFIAAARRASNASSDAETTTHVSRLETLFNQMSGRGAEPAPEAAPQQQPVQAPAEPAKGPFGALRRAISARRKPMLIALTGLIVVLASLQALRSRGGVEQPVAQVETDRPLVSQAAPPARPVETAAALTAPAPEPAPTLALPPAPTPAPPSPIAAAPEAAASPGFAPPLQANGFDVTPVGSTPNPTQRLVEAANNGNAAAQFEMGARLAEGRGVTIDNPAALQWFEKAAEQNLAPAQFRLAAMLERGLGAEKNLKRAAEVYAKAASQGHVRAMHNLGVLYAEGLGGKPDYATAANWFRKAADFGVGDSQYNLAILYARGMGVDKNLPMAWAWFTAAAAQGDKDSAQKRDDITVRLSGVQMTAAKAIADAFRPRTPDPAINQVTTPADGWETLSVASPPRPAAATTPPKAKVSKL